jgi:hypothetical protein
MFSGKVFEMDSLDLVKSLSRSTSSKIVLMVMDGIGGLPDPATAKRNGDRAQA